MAKAGQLQYVQPASTYLLAAAVAMTDKSIGSKVQKALTLCTTEDEVHLLPKILLRQNQAQKHTQT